MGERRIRQEGQYLCTTRNAHIVLRRDGVCIVAKTPDGDMPQIEYWGRDFAFDTAGDALRQLDMRAI